MSENIAEIVIPDTQLVREATDLVRAAADETIFNHSRRVYLWGSLKAAARGLEVDPEVPLQLAPEVAVVTLGVETDVLGLGLGLAEITAQQRADVVAAHARPDFKNRILKAFYEGMADRPGTTFGTMNDDVLAHFDPSFRRKDFVGIIRNNPWPE
ncbi:diguanylate cyclase [Streptomyces sp. LaBMicrA B280]|uniref:diguanylate cyclase n=1 Tax=Streptomyces sp. LaBMicrA B280 TaxID=3391001 RepID=UPI003BA6BE62